MGNLRGAVIGGKLNLKARRGLISLSTVRRGVLVTTLLHSYRLVSAYLYRMQIRSPIAEDAWDKARPEMTSETEAFGQTAVGRLNAARNKAIELISESNHDRSEQSRAIMAIDEAVRSALEINLREQLSGKTVV
jgi:hypothetical protein